MNYNPATNQLVVAGVAGQPLQPGMQTDYKNFAPRLGGVVPRATEKTVVRAGFGVSYVPFVDNTYAYNYPIKTSTYYTQHTDIWPALNPAGGVVNFVTGVPATPTVAFGSDGTLAESAANGTIGLANLYIPLNFKNAYVTSLERGCAAGAAAETCRCRSRTLRTTERASTYRRTSISRESTGRARRSIH